MGAHGCSGVGHPLLHSLSAILWKLIAAASAADTAVLLHIQLSGGGYDWRLEVLHILGSSTFQQMPDLTAFKDAERPMRHFTAIPVPPPTIIKRFAITFAGSPHPLPPLSLPLPYPLSYENTFLK